MLYRALPPPPPTQARPLPLHAYDAAISAPLTIYEGFNGGLTRILYIETFGLTRVFMCMA